MKLPLTGGFYVAQSLLASAQRCVNLYPETNPSESTFPFTHYQTPGSLKLGAPPAAGSGRCIYRASNGALYAVVAQNVYAISSAWVYTLLGSISSPPNPCYIADNGVDALLVDGTPNGYMWDLATDTFAPFVDPNFYGADRVDYASLRFVLNKPGTPIFYYSEPTSLVFDPLDFAAKSGSPDPLISIIASLDQVWLLGELTTEVFYNAGATDAIFERQPGSFMEHGCGAKYSVAKADVWTFWLGQDRQGTHIVYRGEGYQARRISTSAIENVLAGYSTVADAVGFTYQQNGHLFYILVFPTANATWVFDCATNLWHERAWTDPDDGTLNRIRANGVAFAYDKNITIDWENGAIYELRLDLFVDDASPITRVRSWANVVEEGKRVLYRQFTAWIDAGTIMQPGEDPLIGLRWSDDGGNTWGNTVLQSIGKTGTYNTTPNWSRLGYGRNRVFELSWSINAKAALQGAFVEVSGVSKT